MKKSNVNSNVNDEILKNDDGVYVVQTSPAPPVAPKSIFTAENAKKFAKDSLYCAGISLASSLLLHGGAMLVNKVRGKMAEKKAANTATAPSQPAPSQPAQNPTPENVIEAVEAEVLEEEILEEELLEEEEDLDAEKGVK